MNQREYIKKLMQDNIPITVREMLREVRRGYTLLLNGDDERMQDVYDDLKCEAAETYHFGIIFDEALPGQSSFDIFNPSISPDSVIPDNVREKFFRFNFFCAKYLERKSKKTS